MKANVLGDLRAEADHSMLGSAFLETADFKTLIDTNDRPVVIGRRGTGKSALAYRLIKHWRGVAGTDVTVDVYKNMHDEVKFSKKNGTNESMWTSLTWNTFDNSTIYGSSWRRRID